MRQIAERLHTTVAQPVTGVTPDEYIEHVLRKIERCLSGLAPAETRVPVRLSKSIRYSLLSPGKRTRALLTALTAQYWGADPDLALVPACAIEMVHAASLALDDLPVMDDANLRRGRPTNHRIFGDDTVILAAVALVSDAFGEVARCRELPEQCRLDVADFLSEAVGLDGLVAGQEMDLHSAAQAASVEDVEAVHSRKTAALFAACTKIGACVAGVADERLEDMAAFGMELGMAFQTYDDLADAHSDVETAGKDVKNDGNKPTVVSMLGRKEAERIADEHIDCALKLLEPVPSQDVPLVAFVHHLTDALKKRIDVKP
ncbi:MAG: polyprenyl synthetase family protein [Hyphomicrobiales bacterium]